MLMYGGGSYPIWPVVPLALRVMLHIRPEPNGFHAVRRPDHNGGRRHD